MSMVNNPICNVVLVSPLREKNRLYKLDLPHNKFLDAALAVGVSNFPINPIDQRVRESQAYYKVEGLTIPALSTTLFFLDHATGILPSKLVNMNTFSDKCLQIELDVRQRFFINFQGPPSSSGVENIISTLPASAVLMKLIPHEWFKHKTVLIGAEYKDNTDAYRTPFYSSRFSGDQMEAR